MKLLKASHSLFKKAQADIAGFARKTCFVWLLLSATVRASSERLRPLRAITIKLQLNKMRKN